MIYDEPQFFCRIFYFTRWITYKKIKKMSHHSSSQIFNNVQSSKPIAPTIRNNPTIAPTLTNLMCYFTGDKYLKPKWIFTGEGPHLYTTTKAGPAWRTKAGPAWRTKAGPPTPEGTTVLKKGGAAKGLHLQKCTVRGGHLGIGGPALLREPLSSRGIAKATKWGVWRRLG